MAAPNDLPALPARPQDAHKGVCGRVVVVGGSAHYPGAPLLAARAAFESGAGYVEVVAPGALFPALLDALPEAIHHPCGGEARQQLSAEDVPLLLDCAARADALVIGPGMGLAESDSDFLPEAIRTIQEQHPNLPMVLDADALNRLAPQQAWHHCSAQCLLTPHPGEAARLLAQQKAPPAQDRIGTVQALCAQTQATVVLKGEGTLVGQGCHEPWKNLSGNPGLATAGSGDVLSGLLGALCARGLSAYDAARLGVYLHGLAADLYAAEWGPDGLRASHLSQWLSRAMLQHLKDSTPNPS